MNIGTKLKKLREENNLSTQELAELIGDSVENICKYENNELEPSLDKKLALANALHVSLDDFMIHNTNHNNKIIDSSILSRYDEITDEESLHEEYTEENPQDLNETQEKPIAQSRIEFTEKLFDEVFVGRSGKIFIINIIWSIVYIISVILFILINETIMAIIIGVLGVFTFFSALFKYVTYRKAKKEWLLQYGGKSRTHIFFEHYLIVEDEDGEILETLFYQNFQSFVEQKNYLIGMIPQTEKQGLLLIINRLGFENNTYDEVKRLIQAKCQKFMEEKKNPYTKTTESTSQSKEVSSTISKEQVHPKWNTVLWIFIVVSILSMSIIRIIITICTGGDDTLLANLLIYGLGCILPIVSIVLGFVSEIHFRQKSRKNIWVGFIVVGICIIQFVSSISYYIIYTSENNEQRYSQLEVLFKIDLPDTYYTLYQDTETKSIADGENTYLQNEYQIFRFVKAKEVKRLETIIQENWQKVENAIPYYQMSDEIKKEVTLAGISLDSQPNYYTFQEQETEITYLYYFENINSMIVITYQK